MIRTLAMTLALALLASAANGQAVTPRIEQRTSPLGTNIDVGGKGSWSELSTTLNSRLRDTERAKGVAAPSAEERRALPGPLLMERGLRLQPIDREEGVYLFVLGALRSRWEANQCSDPTAPQAATVVLLMFRDSGAAASAYQPPTLAPYMKRALGSGEIFSGAASPWWACSHGMAAITAGLERKSLKEAEWRIPAADRAKLRQTMETAYRAEADRAPPLKPQG